MSSSSNEPLPNVVHSFEFSKKGLPELTPFAFSLTEELSKHYTLTLQATTTDPGIDESKLVGESCTLTLTRAGLVRHVSGLVSEVTVSGVATDQFTPEGDLPRGIVTLVIVPALWVLRQRQTNRIFQNQKVTDVLKKVIEAAFADYGRKVSIKTSRAYLELEYCTQYDETDLEFVERLMATEGIMSYFRQGESLEELVLFDDADQYQKLVTMDHGKVPFATNISEAQALETVSQFFVDARLTSTSAAARAFNWSNGGAPDDSAAKSKDALKRERELDFGEAPVSLRGLGGDGVYAKTSGAGQVKVIQETLLSRKAVARGNGDVTGLSPGVTFELTNALRGDLNRKYLVTAITHTGAQPSGASDGGFAAHADEVRYSNHFECVQSDVLFRLDRPERRCIQTTQTAIVVGDEDITTDVHGRIKVQFHWDRDGKNDQNSSCWVRVAQSSAGIGFGHVFIPRQGQEVVVTFLEGDPDRPLVIGSVYNGISKPPYDLPAEKTRSVIRTRSTPDSDGYNEVSFEDAKDSEELYIQAQKNMKELVKHDHTVLVKNDESMKVEKNQTEEIGEDQTLSVKGSRSRTVAKDEDVSVDGNRSHTVGKDETISIDGNRSLTVGKNEDTSVGGARSVTVGKGFTEDIGGAYAQSVAKNVTEDYAASHKTTVAKDGSLDVGENYTVKIGKKKSESVGATFDLTIEKAFTEKCNDARKTEVAKEFHIKAKKLAIEADDEISIKVGDTSIVLSTSGVTIKSGKVNIEASGNLKLKGSKVAVN